jgi:hypothetical protein
LAGKTAGKTAMTIAAIIVLLIIVSAIRAPRTFAEAEYQSHIRRNNIRFLGYLALFSACAFCLYAFIHAITNLP